MFASFAYTSSPIGEKGLTANIKNVFNLKRSKNLKLHFFSNVSKSSLVHDQIRELNYGDKFSRNDSEMRVPVVNSDFKYGRSNYYY